MSNFAVMRRGLPRTPENVLLLVDDRAEAEIITVELRRRGQDVEAVDLGDALRTGSGRRPRPLLGA